MSSNVCAAIHSIYLRGTVLPLVKKNTFVAGIVNPLHRGKCHLFVGAELSPWKMAQVGVYISRSDHSIKRAQYHNIGSIFYLNSVFKSRYWT
jgi:hypothetical protein